MLPSSKRPPRNQEEVIRTGDYEVILPATPSDDEDRTLLFSGSTKSMLPPRTATPVVTPSMRAPRAADMSLRGLVREGRERPQVQEKTNLRGSVRPRMDAEDRTILRPSSTMPPPSARSAPPPAPSRPASKRPPAMMPTPYAPITPVAPRQTLAPAKASAPPVAISINAPGGGDVRKEQPSDPHGDPPSSVITAKTRIIRARSSMSWAAGLVALGAVVGLVATVIARGDADSIIDATASLVDPQHGTPERANGAAAQAAVLPAFVETAPTRPTATDKGSKSGASCLDIGESTVSAPVVQNTPPVAPAARVASIPGADPTTASRPTPPKAAPVAYARPIPRPAPAAAAPAQASTSSGWLANITPPGAGAPIARPSKAVKSGPDFEGAQAADALAKAQLEASLR